VAKLRKKAPSKRANTALKAAIAEIDARRAVVRAVLDLLADGTSLRQACTKAGVSKSTWLEWVADPLAYGLPLTLSDHYARAREAGLERLAEEILEIADDSSHDTKVDERGNERCDNEWVQRSRLKVDARKWLLSKLLPKKYGDKVDVTSGGEPIAPQVMVIAGREVRF
jgi:hypothetical protein